MSRFKLILAFSCLLFWGAGLWAAGTQVLTLTDYLQAAMEKDLAYKAIFHETATTEGMLRSLYAMFDTRLTASYSYGEQDESVFGAFKVKDIKNTSWSAGATKKFMETGTELSGTFARNDSSSTYESTPSDIDVITNKPAFTWRITQPLWQDLMGVMSRLPIERMELQKDVARLTEEENEETYFESAINLYYDWLALTLAFEPLKESYKNAQLLLKEVALQYKNDVANKTDLLRSQEAVLSYESALEETLYNWNLLGSEIFKKIGRKFTPARSWEELPVVPEVKTDFCVCAHTTEVADIRPFRVINKLLEQYALDQEQNEQKKAPSLAVFAEVTDYKNEDGNTDSFSNLNSRDKKAGLNFSMPLDPSDIKGSEEQLQENIAKTKERLADTQQNLENLLHNYLVKVTAWEKLKENAEQIADYSQERLRLETKRFQHGKTVLRDVADYRNQYAQNKNNQLRRLIELAKLHVSIESLNDRLLQRVKELLKAKEEAGQ